MKSAQSPMGGLRVSLIQLTDMINSTQEATNKIKEGDS